MKIGIIGAMEVEVAYLKEVMTITNTKTIALQEYCEGKIGDMDVVVVECGIGKVRAGMCVQVLVDIFHVTHILNTGVAGSLNHVINVGDVVVSTDAIFHDVNANNFGYELGEVPSVGRVSFEADPMLRTLAKEAVLKAAKEVQVFEGRITTGDQFICDSEKKQWIRDTFHGECCEMEGAAIGEASYLNQIPFVIIRAISDKADEETHITYEEFEAKAALHCAKIVEYMISHMHEGE